MHAAFHTAGSMQAPSVHFFVAILAICMVCCRTQNESISGCNWSDLNVRSTPSNAQLCFSQVVLQPEEVRATARLLHTAAALNPASWSQFKYSSPPQRYRLGMQTSICAATRSTACGSDASILSSAPQRFELDIRWSHNNTRDFEFQV